MKSSDESDEYNIDVETISNDDEYIGNSNFIRLNNDLSINNYTKNFNILVHQYVILIAFIKPCVADKQSRHPRILLQISFDEI